MSYGTCTAYSADSTVFPVDVGTAIKFPSPSHFLVAKGDLIEALSRATKLSHGIADPQLPEGIKRQCLRQQVEMGEQTETSAGTSKYLLDLEGVRHFTRVKTDIPQREKDLFFSFRAMDPERWEYAMGADLTLQPEEYRRMLVEQGQARTSSRNSAFESCGILDRVYNLNFTVKNTKMELLLTGSILVQGADKTLTLDDFTTGEKILSSSAICPNHNRAMAATLRNVQMVLEIVFSPSFRDCLSIFIDDLEGVMRPMELVSSDFLKHCIENSLRLFFRTVRSVRTCNIKEGTSIKNPIECAAFLRESFSQLSEELADHQSMRVEEAYFRKRIAGEMLVCERPTSFKDSSSPSAVVRPCTAHLGSFLKQKNQFGKPFKCEYGQKCRFLHPNLIAMSKKGVRDLIDALPFSVQEEFRGALKLKN